MSKKLVEIMVYSRQKKTKDGKKKFTSYSTKYNFKEDGKEERVTHYCTLKFTQDAFEGSKIKLADIKRGKLLVDASKIGIPDKWEVTQDENGEDVYPVCYVRGGINGFTPIVKEHEFHFNTEDVIEEESEDPEEVTGESEEDTNDLDAIDLPDDNLPF